MYFYEESRLEWLMHLKSGFDDEKYGQLYRELLLEKKCSLYQMSHLSPKVHGFVAFGFEEELPSYYNEAKVHGQWYPKYICKVSG